MMKVVSIRDQRGGVIIMSLLVIAIFITIFGLVWYAFNGGTRARVQQSSTPTTTPRVN